MSARICFVAAPLIARSGVYNSTIELVRAARQRGLDWHAVIGVSQHAGGNPTREPGIHEFSSDPRGLSGVLDLRKKLNSLAILRDQDLLISMVPQSDMALSLGRAPWVAYLRGLPWPASGESKPLKSRIWRRLELAALRRAKQVWATTKVLAADVGGVVDKLVPPGLIPPDHVDESVDVPKKVVWAARYGLDKNPMLFLEAMAPIGLPGVMYGTGPMEAQLKLQAPQNVEIAGWTQRSEVWEKASAYVGTSTREAFGRSAVEAAMLGIPVVISDRFGCAELLYTDKSLANRFVLAVEDVGLWSKALLDLQNDTLLRETASNHLKKNAANLSIDIHVDGVLAAAKEVFDR